MPKPKPWDRLYRRPNSPFWWLRCTVETATGTTRIRESTGETDRGAALKEAERLYREAAKGTPTEVGLPITRKTVRDAYIDYVKNHLSLVAAKHDPQYQTRHE